MSGHLPNFLVIGAMKCATSSLALYLSRHPDIFIAYRKEVNFFSSDHNWKKGLNWYRSHFPSSAKTRGDVSPSYSHLTKFPNASERIYQTIPNAKLIYILREPVSRSISNYIHEYAGNKEDRPIEEALRVHENNAYLKRSQYSKQLEPYLRYFSLENILILTAEELKGDCQETLKKAFSFLEVDPNYQDKLFQIQIHRSSMKRRKTRLGVSVSKYLPPKIFRKIPSFIGYPLQLALYWPLSRKVEPPQLTAEHREELEAYFSADVKRLKKLTGQSFNLWPQYQPSDEAAIR